MLRRMCCIHRFSSAPTTNGPEKCQRNQVGTSKSQYMHVERILCTVQRCTGVFMCGCATAIHQCIRWSSAHQAKAIKKDIGCVVRHVVFRLLELSSSIRWISLVMKSSCVCVCVRAHCCRCCFYRQYMCAQAHSYNKHTTIFS